MFFMKHITLCQQRNIRFLRNWVKCICFLFLGNIKLWVRCFTCPGLWQRRLEFMRCWRIFWSTYFWICITSRRICSFGNLGRRLVDHAYDVLQLIVYVTYYPFCRDILYILIVSMILFQGSNARKMYFMIFERGPRAFIDGTVQLIRKCVAEGSSMQQLCHFASYHISERIAVLSCLKHALAIFLAQVCSILFLVSFCAFD
jgi:hypothetical protein